MTGHRFRSPRRDRETDVRRFTRIEKVMRSAIEDVEVEAKGLRSRLSEAQRSAMYLLQPVDSRLQRHPRRLDRLLNRTSRA